MTTRPTTRARRRGFTIIEVLVAVVITAIGFAAIFSLQIGSMQGNIEAREMAAATNLAERYVATLRREAFQWVAGPRPQAAQSALLGQGPATWHSLTPRPVDHNGRPHVADDARFGSPLARQRFCVQYWMSDRDQVLDGVLNVRVRVIWPVGTLDTTILDAACAPATANAFQPDVGRFRTLVLPAAIRRHES
ncbi:MAG: prepilin-type N-terminal cleavage/methylation domain-containing protein [bacterium]